MPQATLGHAFDKMMTKQATKTLMKSIGYSPAWCFAALVSDDAFNNLPVGNLERGGCAVRSTSLYV
ncbi:MAG: hypothetical protein RLZ68_1429 [Pseudomonadota bacterium]|jgi:hypothetical protein